MVTNIPDDIEIDVSALEIGNSIHADAVQLPEGVEFPHGTNFIIVAVVPPVKEEEVKPADVGAVIVEGAPAAEGVAAPTAGEAKGEKAKPEEAKGKEDKAKEKKAQK